MYRPDVLDWIHYANDYRGATLSQKYLTSLHEKKEKAHILNYATSY